MYDLITNQKGKDGYYKIWHVPESNLLLFVHTGDGDLVLREETYPLASGTLCFIGKNKYHYTCPKNPTQYVRSKLLLDSSDLRALTHTLDSFSDFSDRFNEDTFAISRLSGETLRRVSRLFEEISRFSATEAYRQEELCSAALRLMLHLAKNADVQTQTNPDALQKAIQYIHRHISEDLSIDAISEACYVSKYYLCRAFKKRIGLTIMEYILQTRLTMAKELLRKEAYSITQISDLCGFSSPSYFSRVFKEKTALSPSKYRKQP